MDDCRQRIIGLINGIQDSEKLELILRFVKKAAEVRSERRMKNDKDTSIIMYQREILRLLRDLWKQQDFEMWQQIYTVIHCFCGMKGVGGHDGKR